MTILSMPPSAHARRVEAEVNLEASAAAVRDVIAEITTLREALDVYKHCLELSRLLDQVTYEAGVRCDQLSLEKDV